MVLVHSHRYLLSNMSRKIKIPTIEFKYSGTTPEKKKEAEETVKRVYARIFEEAMKRVTQSSLRIK